MRSEAAGEDSWAIVTRFERFAYRRGHGQTGPILRRGKAGNRGKHPPDCAAWELERQRPLWRSLVAKVGGDDVSEHASHRPIPDPCQVETLFRDPMVVVIDESL